MNPSTTAGLLAQVPGTENHLGMGESVLFWVLAPLMVLAALGLLFAKKAVHVALAVAFVMISLAVMYAAQGAQFLFAAQIVVYTGAVMMLFLFVLMLVGVDSADSLVETIKHQRLVAFLAGGGLLLLGVGMVTGLFGGRIFGLEQLVPPAPAGLDEANVGGNPQGVARILFSDYVVTLELTGALLITAALGAMILTHRERLVPRVTQRELSARRIRRNEHVAGLPAPGVFARHNSVETPALLPDGTPSELSVSRVLRARNQQLSPVGLGTPVREIVADISGHAQQGTGSVGDHMDRGVTGTNLPDDETVDGTSRRAETKAALDALVTDQVRGSARTGTGDEQADASEQGPADQSPSDQSPSDQSGAATDEEGTTR